MSNSQGGPKGPHLSDHCHCPEDGGHAAQPQAASRPALRFFGPADPDHLHLESAYHIRSGQIVRAISRQLFCYPPSDAVADPSAVFDPVPDVAKILPTRANGGLSADRRTLRIKLRPDVCWDSEEPRPIVAQDFIRGLERIAEPVTPGDIRDYFMQTIAGMRAYCDAYAQAFARTAPSEPALSAFRAQHRISGLDARDGRTLVIDLVEPANDMLHLLALGYAAALPQEVGDAPVGSAEFRRRYVSSGPYRMTEADMEEDGDGAKGQAIVLTPNPVWRQDSDPIRSQTVGAIHAAAGADSSEAMRDAIARGQVNAAWPFGIVSWDRSELPDDAFPATYPGYTLNPYVVINMLSPNADGAMRKRKLRQALAYAIDKAALGELFSSLHGVAVEPLHSVLPPSSLGHRGFNPYPTPHSRGDRVLAGQCLKQAGYPDGLTLKAAVRDIGLHQTVMDIISGNLAACGIDIERRTYTQRQYYGELLLDPDRAAAGDWDIAVAGWTPDWFGNNGRAVFRQLFRTDRRKGTMNFGCYSNPTVDELIDRALGAEDLSTASDFWHAANRLVMADLPVVPILAFACQCCAARTGANGWLTWDTAPGAGA